MLRTTERGEVAFQLRQNNRYVRLSSTYQLEKRDWDGMVGGRGTGLADSRRAGP
jgi:hypothetical protein